MNKERILITGASRGIGGAAARRFAAPGRELRLLARSERELEARCREVEARGGAARYEAVDFADRDGLRATFEAIEREDRPFDGLVLNAGVANNVDFRDSSRASIQREIDVNYVAPADLLQRVLPGMIERGGGRVVVVGSLSSLLPFPGNASYSASKTALLSLIRSLRVELRGTGVHLGVVLPGYTRTRMTENHTSFLPAMTPEAVADAIADCYDHRKSVVVPGAMNRAAARLFSAFPETSDRLLHRLARFVIPRPA